MLASKYSRMEIIEPDENKVTLATGRTINYDTLVVSTGSKIVPEETEETTAGARARNRAGSRAGTLTVPAPTATDAIHAAGWRRH